MTLRVARLEDHVSVETMRTQVCSVLWLIPDEPVELSNAMYKIATSTGLGGWVIVGSWERTASLSPEVDTLIKRDSPEGEFRIDSTRVVANVLKVEESEGVALWREFVARLRKDQICGVLVHAQETLQAGIRFAAIDLTLAGAARQARPGASHEAVVTCRARAFVAETLAGDAVAVSRLEAEPLTPGLALTGRPDTIDRLAMDLEGEARLDDLTFERAKSLATWYHR